MVIFLAIAVIAGGVLLASILRGPAIPPGPPLIYAHPPTDDAEAVRKGYAPLARYLQRTLERRVEIVVTPDYATLRDNMASGDVHLANLSPLLFLQTLALDAGVRPLVSHTYEGARTYQALLITRMDSESTAIEELRGKRFCFVDRNSTSGYLLPRRYLRKSGIDPDHDLRESRFSGSHTKVMNDIVNGRCDAGSVYSGAFANAAEAGVASSQLRLMSVAGLAPWDVVCASSKLPRNVGDQVRRLLLDFLPERDVGGPIVSKIFRIDGFVEPRLEDFRAVEEAARAEGLLRLGPTE